MLDARTWRASAPILALTSAIALVATACATRQLRPAPLAAPGPIASAGHGGALVGLSYSADAVVYLIGDAGAATRETPILIQLKQDIAERAANSEVVVVFLGDNIYERGLHPPDHPNHQQEVEHLEAQIEVLRGTGARGIFVPGNHDWGYSDERGLEQIKRQEDYIAAAAALQDVNVTMLPAAGCPGPVLLPVGRTALLALLETDLWLRDELPGPDCAYTSTDESIVALRAALSENAAGAEREVLVLAHHPLVTFGPHGGHYSTKEKIFPATKLWGPLYIPLPFVYPLVKKLAGSDQDLSSSRYEAMRDQLAAVFMEFPEQPLAYAAGHDHSLQVLEGSEHGVRFMLVSGAGSRLTPVATRDALFTAGEKHHELGYLRLEFLRDGGVLLSVLTDGTASCDEAAICPGTLRYRHWLSRQAATPRAVATESN